MGGREREGNRERKKKKKEEKGNTNQVELLGLLLCHIRRDGRAWVLHRRRHLDASHGGGSDVE